MHDLRSRSRTPLDRLRLRRARFGRSPTEEVGFSIPIATYGRDDLLIGRTLPNLLEQTFGNLEIIVVHDGPSEALGARLREFNDSRITYLEVQRPSYPEDPVQRWMVAGFRARNFGLRNATKQWIYWMSDDDIILSNALETLYSKIDASSSIELYYGDYLAWVGGQYVRKVQGDTDLKFPITGLPALAVRRDLSFIEWSGWSHKKGWNRPSDLDMLVRMKAAGVRMEYVPRLFAVSPPVGATGLTGSAAHRLLG